MACREAGIRVMLGAGEHEVSRPRIWHDGLWTAASCCWLVCLCRHYCGCNASISELCPTQQAPLHDALAVLATAIWLHYGVTVSSWLCFT